MPRSVEASRLVAGLNEAQLRAVVAEGGPIVVLAGAGSGKTRVLTRRIARRVVIGETDPARVIAVTFTRKAADELGRRLRQVGLRADVRAGTFHRLAYTQLKERWAERRVDPPTLLDNRARLVGRLVGSTGRGELREVMAELDWARARLVGPEHYEMAARDEGRRPPLPAASIADLLDRYQQEKRKRRVVDFDDLLLLAIRDLRRDTGYAEAIRWRFRHLYVDEFQDVNPLQFELLSEWRGGRDDLFVVGDPNQAIYGWNGADPNLLRRFASREASAMTIELAENYRSSPQILAVAAPLAATPLTANQPDGPVPTITAHRDDVEEAAGIAAACRQARSVAGTWRDQAVLVRTNAQLVTIERALRDAAVPVRIRSGAGPLATPEVRGALSRLAEPEADLVIALEELDATLHDQAGDGAGGREPGAAQEPATPAEIERRANLAALSRLAHEYLSVDPTPSGPGLEAWLATMRAGEVDTDADAVELTTFHGAKGLEWAVVHIAGLEEGFVPIAYASTRPQLAEERRLLYVAITRARQELHLSWAASRTFTNAAVSRQASPMLAELAAAIEALGTGPAARVDWRAGLARSRASYEAATVDRTPDHGPLRLVGNGNRQDGPGWKQGPGRPDLVGRSVPPGSDAGPIYQALLSWRERRARAARVPTSALLSERVVRAIASERPTTRAQLAAIPGMTPAKLGRFGDELLSLVVVASATNRPGC